MPDHRPTPWAPPPAPPLTGQYLRNDDLAAGDVLPLDRPGPEDVIVGTDGTAYSGTADGAILAVSPTGTRVIAEVAGRPLGVEWYGDDILVCNAHHGLQLVSLAGSVKSLARGFGGSDFTFTNNAAVARDGTIYFTDSSTRWAIEEYENDLVEGMRTGRLFARRPDGEITLLAEDLQFANGVALDATEQSVFVAETGRYRVHRFWLAGDRAGESEVFVDNLPGFPDNLTFGHDTLWVACASPRQRLVDFMMPRSWMRSVTLRMPASLKPKPVRHGMVFGYTADGTLTHNLQDASGRVAVTTSARYHDGRLFVGSLTESQIVVVDLS